MTKQTQAPNATESADPRRRSTTESAGRRGDDYRRAAVNPADNPAPHSPAADEDAIRKGEDNLARVKPY